MTVLFIAANIAPFAPAAPIPVTALPADLQSANERSIPFAEKAMPPLKHFSSSLVNGLAGQVVGVYVPEILALPVAQQPAGSPGYVSSTPDVVTQFGMAARFGTTGLLAHNYLSGALFFELELGQNVVMVKGDGQLMYYTVTEVQSFQALSPNNPYSQFVDLQTGDMVTAHELFFDVYAGSDQLVFQTCIEAAGDPSWGRLFVTAKPSLSPQIFKRMARLAN